MTLIDELKQLYPQKSISRLLMQTSFDLIKGSIAIGELSEEMTAKVAQLVDAGWGGAKLRIFDRDTEYAGLPADEVTKRLIVKVLSDDYQPSATDNSQLVLDALVLHRLFMECENADPKPMALIARGFASAGVLLKEMMRACKETKEMNTVATNAIRSADKQAANRQPTIDAYYRVTDRPSKKPSKIVNEIHQKTGTPKKTIKRHLTHEGLIRFKGYGKNAQTPSLGK